MSVKSDREIGVAVGVVVKSTEENEPMNGLISNLLRLVGFCPHIWNSPVKFSQGQQEENRTLLILHTSLPTSYDFRFSLRLKGFTTQVMTTSPIK